MIGFIADELSLCLVINKIIPIEKRKYYIYGIELILCDLLIFLMIAVVAFITRKVLLSTIFTISFCLLRSYTGGYHCKSYIGCYIATMTNYFLLLIFNTLLSQYKVSAVWIMLIITTPIIWKFSPIKNNNISFDEKEKNKYKKISRKLVVLVIFLCAISYFLLLHEIAFSFAWTMFSTAFLMLLEIILQKEKEGIR